MKGNVFKQINNKLNPVQNYSTGNCRLKRNIKNV